MIRTTVVFTLGTAILVGALTAQPGLAMDGTIVKKDGADLAKARALIKEEKWDAALTELKRLENTIKTDSNVYNLLGFASRKNGAFETSYDYYQKALSLNPENKSAREYLGELHIQRGEMDKAREQAAILAKLCPDGCEERADLDEALAEAEQK